MSKPNSPIPVAILGATGYAGEGTLRLLLGHDGFNVVHAGSDRLAGTPVSQAVPALTNETDLVLQEDTPDAIRKSGARAVVLCKKSPEVTTVVPELLEAGVRLVDIGAEFRLRTLEAYEEFYKSEHHCPQLLAEAVYGLSEIHTQAIREARVVGNPGCYPTSILLPLIPLFQGGLVDTTAAVVAVSLSGLSGAGRRFVESNNNLFHAANENIHSYKIGSHQHVGEINQELCAAAQSDVHCTFAPHLAPMTRGIHSTITATLSAGATLPQVFEAWSNTYAGRPFVRVRETPQAVEVANVVHTNYADFSATSDGETLVITSALDNLIKGASGQAVQNLNLMYGYAEDAGLKALGV